jgi:ATP-dependent helicase/nuclease subunit A
MEPVFPSDPSRIQHEAADPCRSVWVAASAGSGKTKVLTDRVLRLLLTGAAPSHILCITYTRAAAAEMLSRVHDRLALWLGMEEAALAATLTELCGAPPAQEVLRRARRLFALLLEETPGLRVQTFHSFCQSLLARFPLEADVPPHFTPLEEREAAALLEEARQRLLQAGLGKTDPRLAAAIADISAESGEWGFTELTGAIIRQRRVIERILMQPDGAARHNTRLYALLDLPFYGVSEDYLATLHLPVEEATRGQLTEAAAALEEGSKTDRELAEKIGKFLRLGALDNLCSALLTAEGTPRKKLMTKAVAERHLHLNAFLHELAERAERFTDARRALVTARISDAAMVVAEALFALYTDLKRRRGALDFDDLVLHTQALLRREEIMPWILYKLDGRIDHLLIDEAQDTSPEQWEIKEALEDEFFSGVSARPAGRTLFVVGDEKQSVYRFQGADPEGFSRALARTRGKTEAAGEAFSSVAMTTSFRSASAILRVVDAVFSDTGARHGVLREDAALRHTAFRRDAPGSVTLWPLLRPSSVSPEEGEEHAGAWPLPDTQNMAGTPRRILAEHVADTIAGWLRERRTLTACNRPVRAGDILVLLRSRTGFMPFLSRALKERGVPVAGLDRLRLREHLAVQDLLALAHVLLLPEDDYSLACLLKSPLYNFPEETLFALAHERAPASLWERLRAWAGTEAECVRAREELSALLTRADYITPHALYADLLYARGGKRRFLARMGAEAEDVLELFMNQALEYEQTHIPSLQGFVAWMEGDSGYLKRDMEQAEDAVRMMTVHGAKGLEAPVVFLPEASAPPPAQQEKIFFLREREDECAVFLPSRERCCQALRTLRDSSKEEDAKENNRLLYVAMTRARDELYLCGYEYKKASSSDTWYSWIRAAMERMPDVQRIPMKLNGAESFALRVEDAGKTPERAAPSAEETPPPPLPEAFLRRAEPEAPRAPALSPSRLEEEYAAPPAPPSPSGPAVSGVARGILAHRLLHLLHGAAHATQEETLHAYLARHAPQMEAPERTRLAETLLHVLRHPDFALVFSPDALAEVPIAGEVEGVRFSGQMDRLLIRDEEVLAVDFKTGNPPQDGGIPSAHRKQMQAYGALLAQIYPGKRVRLALLYLDAPIFLELEAI